MKSPRKILRIGVICIGDELLKGFTINTNLSDIGNTLLEYGYVLDSASVIKDREDLIKKEVKIMIDKGIDIILTTGGLGPTVDDLTKKAISDFSELPFVRDQKVVEQLKTYWSKRTQPMPDAVLNQAMIPEGSYIFPNKVGTAPGLKISLSSDASEFPSVILLPGPPGEMNPMLKNYVIPYLESLEDIKKNITETIFVIGLPESKVEEAILPLLRKSELGLAICASPEAVKIYLSGSEKYKVKSKVAEIRALLGTNVLPLGITSSVEYLVNHCINNKITISTAESCTGGMISSAITDIPGASEIFKGTIVSYSNEWKQNLLGVSEQTLKKFGAVSKECAEEMVINLCEKFGTQAGLSVTGIAGPGGGTDEKPVGLVFIGAKYKNKIVIKKFIFPGKRIAVRIRTMHSACRILRDLF